MDFTCHNCKYNVGSTCRRNAPFASSAASVAIWPTVRDTDWCGQHVHISIPQAKPGRPRHYTRKEVIEHIRMGLPKPWVNPGAESKSRCKSYQAIQTQLLDEGTAKFDHGKGVIYLAVDEPLEV